MKLGEWRRQQGWTQQQLADALGIAQGTVSLIERHNARQVPSPETIVAAWRISRGAVTPTDFYDLPPLDQLALPMDDLAPAPLFEGAR